MNLLILVQLEIINAFLERKIVSNKTLQLPVSDFSVYSWCVFLLLTWKFMFYLVVSNQFELSLSLFLGISFWSVLSSTDSLLYTSCWCFTIKFVLWQCGKPLIWSSCRMCSPEGFMSEVMTWNQLTPNYIAPIIRFMVRMDTGEKTVN